MRKYNMLSFLISLAGFCLFILISMPQFKFLVALVAILFIPGLIVYRFYIDAMYKGSIRYVPKRFVFNQYTITNDHCTIKYTPDEKIVVTDNIVTNKRRDLRTFTLSKQGDKKLNINKCWNQICRIFDSFVSLDSLEAFFNFETSVEVKLIKMRYEPEQEAVQDIKIDATNSGPKFVDINNVRPDVYAQGTNIANADGGKFVDMKNIQEAKKVVERNIDAPEFVDMGQVLTSGSKKIDVNNCEAGELSILPGINIVMAKKIIEYRDTNGLFKSEDDFIQAANVKEHFVQKIKSMIIIGTPQEVKQDDDYDEGRIVDF